MLTRFMAWFAACTLLIIAATPLRAAPPHDIPQAPLTHRVFVPLASADLTRPDWVRIQSARRYATDNAVFVVGEVANIGSAPVYGVEMEATFFNAAGENIGTANDYALFEQTKPNQRTPFHLVFTDAPAQVARHTVRVVNWNTSSPFNPQPLQVVNQQTRTNGQMEVFGEVRNPSTVTLADAVVVATLYDANGNVVDVIGERAGRPQIAPGSTTVYAATAVQSFPYNKIVVQGEGFAADAPQTMFNLRVEQTKTRSFSTKTDLGTTYLTVGEAINDAAAPGYDVELEARYFNAANQLVAVTSSYYGGGATGLGRTDQGKRNPFEIGLVNPPTNIARAEVTATAYGKGLFDYRSIQVVSKTPRQAANETQVVGRVRNTTDPQVVLAQAYVAVTYYDAAGRVVDVAFGAANVDNTGTPQPLGIGAEAEYVAFNGRTVSYSLPPLVQAEGFVAP